MLLFAIHDLNVCLGSIKENSQKDIILAVFNECSYFASTVSAFLRTRTLFALAIDASLRFAAAS